jgi:hypothetical protein
MTLPTGTISMSQIRDEYGFGNPVSLGSARGKPGAPGAGAVISMSQMRGLSNWQITYSQSNDDGPSTTTGIVTNGMTLRGTGTAVSSVYLYSNVAVVWTYSIYEGATLAARQSATPVSGETNGNASFVGRGAVGSNNSILASRTNWNVTATYNGQTKSLIVICDTSGRQGGGTGGPNIE